MKTQLQSIFCVALLVSAMLGIVAPAPAADNEARAVLGTWEGESICTVRPSPCHDEHVIYDISKGEKDTLKMSADKVVDGKRDYMGTLTCTYSAPTLKCSYRGDDEWRFEVKDRKMTGELHLGNGTLYRRISVEKK